MRFRVEHVTTCRYDRWFRLAPHCLRPRPRSDGNGDLVDFVHAIEPHPALRTPMAWIPTATSSRPAGSRARQRRRASPVASSGTGARASRARVDEPLVPGGSHATPLRRRLAPWLGGRTPESVRRFARSLAVRADSPLAFVDGLNRVMAQTLQREIRLAGAAQAPARTMQRGRGACRDLAVLFIAACRSQGLAARFVGGYQHRDDAPLQRHRHAWAEVYLQDVGWKGLAAPEALAVRCGRQSSSCRD